LLPNSTATRYLTENIIIPRGCKPQGAQALSNAERQARYRARHQTAAAKSPTQTRRPIDRRSRPQRWREAVDMLLALQADYADWLAALPDSLQGGATAEALEAIVDLDLTSLADVEPPRGYGRD
jgi:hypothetical protein